MQKNCALVWHWSEQFLPGIHDTTFCLTGLFSQKLLQVNLLCPKGLKINLSGFLVRDFLQVRCPSCPPTNSIKALKGYLIFCLQFNGRFSRWTQVSWHQNVSILDFIGARMMEVVVTTSYKTCSQPITNTKPDIHNTKSVIIKCCLIITVDQMAEEKRKAAKLTFILNSSEKRTKRFS